MNEYDFGKITIQVQNSYCGKTATTEILHHLVTSDISAFIEKQSFQIGNCVLE